MSYLPIIIIIAVCVIYLPRVLKHMKKQKEDQEEYLRAHADAARVFLRKGPGGLYSNKAVVVTLVDGEPPVAFSDGFMDGQGILLLPGKHVVDVQASNTRPGILHKTVTTLVGTSKQELTAEAGKRYRLTFDFKKEEYVFEEIQN